MSPSRRRGPRKRTVHAPHVQTLETRARQRRRKVYEEVARCLSLIEADRERRRNGQEGP